MPILARAEPTPPRRPALPTRRLTGPVAVLLALAACGPPTDEAPAPAEGDVVVGRAPPAVGGVPSIVLFEPAGGGERAQAGPASTEPLVMDQFMMAFSPEVLVAQPSRTVRFENGEDVPHSVEVRLAEADSVLFSVSTDRGLAFEHAFDRPGAYDVSCPIHPGMRAFILVDPAPFHVVSEPDGSFRLEGLPPGRYRARVWSRRGELRSEREVEVGSGRTELGLTGT